jgi:hypothetical protein
VSDIVARDQTSKGIMRAKRKVRRILAFAEEEIERTLESFTHKPVEAMTANDMRKPPIKLVVAKSSYPGANDGRTERIDPASVRRPKLSMCFTCVFSWISVARRQIQPTALPERTQIVQSKKGDNRTTDGSRKTRANRKSERRMFTLARLKKANGKALLQDRYCHTPIADLCIILQDLITWPLIRFRKRPCFLLHYYGKPRYAHVFSTGGRMIFKPVQMCLQSSERPLE